LNNDSTQLSSVFAPLIIEHVGLPCECNSRYDVSLPIHNNLLLKEAETYLLLKKVKQSAPSITVANGPVYFFRNTIHYSGRCDVDEDELLPQHQYGLAQMRLDLCRDHLSKEEIKLG
jgi:hypothetical protein